MQKLGASMRWGGHLASEKSMCPSKYRAIHLFGELDRVWNRTGLKNVMLVTDDVPPGQAHMSDYPHRWGMPSQLATPRATQRARGTRTPTAAKAFRLSERKTERCQLQLRSARILTPNKVSLCVPRAPRRSVFSKNTFLFTTNQAKSQKTTRGTSSTFYRTREHSCKRGFGRAGSTVAATETKS